MRIHRREFLKTSAGLALTTFGSLPAECADARGAGQGGRGPTPGRLTDVNVTLSRWPGRRLPLDETAALAVKLREQGVSGAWAGSFDGLLHKDLGSVNRRLAAECLRFGRGILLPFGSINPRLPDWEEELRRCQEEHQMPGIRLHPNYHGYGLDDPRFERLLDLAVERRLIVQVALAMEDERMQQALLRVPRVEAGPLAELARRRPGLRLVLLNWFGRLKGELLDKLGTTAQIYFDIATVEGVAGVAKLMGQLPSSRILFGSHAPFFYFESALLKLKESALTGAELAAVCAGNARSLLESRARPG